MPDAHILTTEERFCLEGCRSYAQYVHMRRQFEAKICSFCQADPEVNIILWANSFAHCWGVAPQFLRKELKYHFIIAPKRHVRYPWELHPHEHASIEFAQRLLAEKFDLRGGIIATRFGDMQLNAGTVPHLHFNIMVPNGTGEVRIPVYKDPRDREKNALRAAGFAKRYEAGEPI